MKKCNSFLAFLIIGTVGTLWHFIYEWSGGNAVIGIIAPVNESVWEHLKMLFFPALFYFVIEYLLCKKGYENYIPAAVLGIFAGIFTITAFYYTYSGVLGFGVTALDIVSYFVGLIAALWVKRTILRNKCFCSKTAKYSSLLLAAVTGVLFVVWSFYPPPLGIIIPPA
ncbi:MAG: DUF6512 family protein [Acutalibacteraceae bacterium]